MTTVVSISGIRGVFNVDVAPDELIAYVSGFVRMTSAQRLLIGRDTRSTGEAIGRLVRSAALGSGANVVDYGVISTPALFRESRREGEPAVMVTASHNEPEWNGLKFIVAGKGIDQAQLDEITQRRGRGRKTGEWGLVSGSLRLRKTSSYNRELIGAIGEGSCDGVRVVLDLNGSAAIAHASTILRGLGCRVGTIGDAPGFFSRTIDPTNDPLDMLCKSVKREKADVGFAFDCDGDRLVLVDDEGTKRTGDYMLTLALSEMLQKTEDKRVVVSIDTTRAVDDVVEKLGGEVFRSRVGESNVIRVMEEKGVRLGGEGSSGGVIDGSFNYCRDSMLAATTIVAAIKKKGTKIFDQVRSYQLARVKLEVPRKRAQEAVKKLQKEYSGQADTLDGLKIRISDSSWVLIRVSGTEDVVRVSAEAPSVKEAEHLAGSYLGKVRRLGA